MINRFTILLVIGLTILQGCDMFESHPYDGNIRGETGINVKNIKRIEEACKDKATIRFAVISDTQRCYNETRDAVIALNKQENIDFIIHAGDIADFGLTKEYLWMRDIMNDLRAPYIAILGNHDCLANGEEVFRKVYGEVNFSFLAGNTKFVCLNTNALEFDYSRPVPDFQFIEEQFNDEREEYEKTIVAMHVRPFSEQFNNNIVNAFQYAMRNLKGMQFCINGHDHSITKDDLFNDGILYYGVSNIEKRKYLLFTLHPDGTYNYEVVEF